MAEEKLVSFCGQVLKSAAEIQSTSGEAASMEAHRALELRAPVVVKVNRKSSLWNFCAPVFMIIFCVSFSLSEYFLLFMDQT